MGTGILRQRAAARLERVAARLRTSGPGVGAFGRREADRDPALERARLATYPRPYPNGWYALADLRELDPGPLHVRALGRQFVVFRTESGQVAALDAHCPHLGANLAGGVVKGECIECPFHEWTFGVDGRARRIPYASRVSPSLRARAYPVDVRAGFVCAYVEDGEPAPSPPYRLPEPMRSGDFVHRGDHDAGLVRMHLVEFVENSADLQHFAPLHGDMFLPWTRRKIPGLKVRHEARWERDPKDPHVTWFRNRAVLEVLGRPVEGSGMDAAICIAGPGGIVTFEFDVPKKGRIVLYQTHTPVEPLTQRIRFRWYAERAVPSLLAWYVVGNWIAHWREDIAIWEHKTFRRRPMLVPGDGPLLEMRRWYARFYSDGRLFSDEGHPEAAGPKTAGPGEAAAE